MTAKMILSSILVLLNVAFSLAAYPHFVYPEYFQTDPKYQADLPTWQGVVDQAFKDAITLARVVILTGDKCDPAFLRYFQPQDYSFVQSLFKRIANIPPNTNIDDPAEALALLQNQDLASTLSPVWDKLLLSFTNTKTPWDIGKTASCKIKGVNGYMNYDFKAPREANDPARGEFLQVSGYLGMCPTAINWQTCVDLKTTENPPDWAKSPDGKGFANGWSCNGFANRDTGDMRTIGSTILHEIFHWPDLFKPLPAYMQAIEKNDVSDVPQIADYTFPGSFPNPYGPFNAAKLATFPKNTKTGYSQAIQNADNYVWYANSKYWAFTCKKKFGPAKDESDASYNELRPRGPPMYAQWGQLLPDPGS